MWILIRRELPDLSKKYSFANYLSYNPLRTGRGQLPKIQVKSESLQTFKIKQELGRWEGQNQNLDKGIIQVDPNTNSFPLLLGTGWESIGRTWHLIRNFLRKKILVGSLILKNFLFDQMLKS